MDVDWPGADPPAPAQKRPRFSMELMHEAVDQIPLPEEGFDALKVEALFERYAQPLGLDGDGDRCVAGCGLTRLESDFGWPEDTACTYFALRFCIGSRRPDIISRDEWARAFAALRCDSVERAKRRLIHYQVQLKASPGLFPLFFNYVFKCLNRRSLRCVEVHAAQRALLTVIGTRSPFTFTFCQFLNEAAHRGLNADQWRNFLTFSSCIRPDFANYDVNDAWPTLYDEYVEWLRRKGVCLTHADPAA